MDGESADAKLSDFKLVKVVGRGSFGKVFLVEHKKTGKTYAMKSLNKATLIEFD